MSIFGKATTEAPAAKSRSYVCKRARMAAYLMDRGFKPYNICPNRDNPKFDVFLFHASPELYEAVKDYISRPRPQV